MMRRFFLLAVAAQFLLVACTCDRTPVAPTLKKLGEACATDDSCETGLCDAIPGVQAVCVKKCADGCEVDQICTQLTPDRFSCQKDPRQLCKGCMVDSDCPYPSDKCVVVNQEKVCGRDCAFDQNCPSGYSCRNALGIDGKPKLQQCTPTVASCACLQRGDLSQPCTLTNSIGTCGGIKTCNLVTNTVTCSAQVPAGESCNGIDDDCNGTIDEIAEQKSCGDGACKRFVNTCSMGKPSTCVPGTPIDELCNAIDDDCDGETDETFPVQSDPANCGACGFKCADHVVHATGLICIDGKCDYTACEPGWVDADGDRTNGCEHSCGGPDLPDAPALADANCDGFDGEPTKGIFVSASTGDDLKDGATQANAVKTIARGIFQAVKLNKRDVYIAKGTYTEQLKLSGASGLNIAGGYDPTVLTQGYWTRKLDAETIVSGANPGLDVDSVTNVSIQLLTIIGADGTVASPTAYGASIRGSQMLSLQSLDIKSGNGLAGTSGSGGVAGASGANGGVGGQACAEDDRGGGFALACNLFAPTKCRGSRPAGGSGGASSCSFPGGPGGQPSKETSTNDSVSSAVPGDPGSSAPLGDGVAGVGVPRAVTPSGRPYFGTEGSPGQVAGVNGSDAAASTLTAAGWVISNGVGGTPGSPGKGGGGGGGGAGGWLPLTGTQIGNSCQSYGSAGGGGGGGGCGGPGGEGGKGGGASIGVFIVGSTVTGNNCIATAGNGGNGGKGGTAGPGGPGGEPGDSFPLDGENRATLGGRGGKGGSGAAGGAGGGGAGGSSIGVAKNSSTTMPDSVFGLTKPGTAGTGGSGIASGGAPGAAIPKTTF